MGVSPISHEVKLQQSKTNPELCSPVPVPTTSRALLSFEIWHSASLCLWFPLGYNGVVGNYLLQPLRGQLLGEH